MEEMSMVDADYRKNYYCNSLQLVKQLRCFVGRNDPIASHSESSKIQRRDAAGSEISRGSEESQCQATR